MLKRDEISDPQSCFNKARSDERVFVLLERDIAAPCAIREWAMKRVELGKNKATDPQIKEALNCADKMESCNRLLSIPPVENLVAEAAV